MRRSTKKDFNLFKAEFLRWQQKLGLTQYNIVFCHEPLEDAHAEIYVGHVGGIATVTFSSEIAGAGKLNFDPVRSGKHEALELLVSRLECLACARFLLREDIREECHAIIRRLEAILR